MEKERRTEGREERSIPEDGVFYHTTIAHCIYIIQTPLVDTW
jgi:hypothetical protein